MCTGCFFIILCFTRVGYSMQMWYRMRMRKKVGPGMDMHHESKPSILGKGADDDSDGDSDGEFKAVGATDTAHEHKTSGKTGSGRKRRNSTAREILQAELQQRPKSIIKPASPTAPNTPDMSVAANMMKAIIGSFRRTDSFQMSPRKGPLNSARPVSVHVANLLSARIGGGSDKGSRFLPPTRTSSKSILPASSSTKLMPQVEGDESKENDEENSGDRGTPEQVVTAAPTEEEGEPMPLILDTTTSVNKNFNASMRRAGNATGPAASVRKTGNDM